MNISVFATLFSGSSELAKIPVDLRVTVYGGQNVSSCAGKLDKELCMGGMCCNQVCVVGAECCQSYDCPTGETCSSSFKCESGITPSDECEGMSDSSTCSTGVCCSEQCVECCTDGDCTSGTCSSFNICETPPVNECDGMADLSGCSDGGVCCSGYCMTGYTCCVDDNCNDWQTCSSGTCVTKGNGGDGDEPAGIDMVTIGLIIGGVAAAAVAGFFVFTKLKKKTGEGDEELEPGEEKDEDEFSDEDFY